MNNQNLVSSIMTRDVVTLKYNDGLEKAEKLFKSRKIRHIPVVKKDNIIGMLSYTDLLRISFADAFSEYTYDLDTSVYSMFELEQVMARHPFSVNSSATIKEVAQILSEREFHALPVVDNNKLVGIVTTTDLIKYLLALL